MASLLDRCGFVPTAGGTSDFTVSSAITGYMTPASAGAVNAATYYYFAESSTKSEWEVGLGTYTVSGTVFARTTVIYSSNSNNKVNFSAPPNVFITFLLENKCSSSDFGLAKVDGTTITASSGVISAATLSGKKVRYGIGPPFSSTTTTFSSGFAVGIMEILPKGATIESIGVMAGTASGTTNWRGGIYSDSSLTMNAKLAETNLVSGIVQGINVADVTSTYTNNSGSDMIIWITIVTDTANFSMLNSGAQSTARLWNNSGSTLPSTASAQSTSAAAWSFFAFGAGRT